MPRVRLAKVTEDNWEDVVDLELSDDQQDFVADNTYSLAESKFDRSARPRAIYAGKQIVGFLMYDVETSRGARKATIYRFMIDKAQQGKGYGRAAMECALAEIRAIRGVTVIAVSYMPKNKVARGLYRSFGFVERGRDEDGETIAVLKL
jgi:diamine N-acetyltransferase